MQVNILILSPEQGMNFDLGCLTGVFQHSSVQGHFKVNHKHFGESNVVNREQMLYLKSGDILILTGADIDKLSKGSRQSIQGFIHRGGDVVVVGANQAEVDFAISTQAAALESGLPVLIWSVKQVRERVDSQAAETILRQFQINPSKIGYLFDENCQSLQGSQALKMVINWAQQNLAVVKTVDVMVDKACMSRRNFDRQFKLAMGLSAKAWLTEQRLERAKSYLKFSNLDIDEIAEVSGFGTYPNLRNCFTRKLGQTPNSYRILSRVQ